MITYCNRIVILLFLAVLLICPVSSAKTIVDEDNSAKPPLLFKTCNDDVQQLIVVNSNTNKKQTGVLAAWEKVNGNWTVKYSNIKVNVGKNGLIAASQKREGDGSTPEGIYALKRAFGYNKFATKMPYIQVTDKHYWIDDAASPFYNQLVYGETSAKSYERMRRADYLYKLGIVIEYNTEPIVPGQGSAIFMHIRLGPEVPTTGCISMSETDIKKLLKWLDPTKKPTILISN